MKKSKMKETAFTLAETLITLGIIAVVAALTLPAVLADKRAKELETSFKKQLSVIQNVLIRMEMEKGEPYTRNSSSATRTFKKEFVKYFKIIKDCNFEDCLKVNDKNVYKDLTNKYDTFTKFIDDGQFILHDGTMIMLNDAANEPLLISFDVNGPYKKPNRYGQDLFTFQIMENGKLLPMGADGTWYTDENFCSTEKGDIKNGLTCAYRAVTEPDYFKKLPR